MTNSDRELEVILQNYKPLLSAVMLAEETKMYPHKRHDTNIGGGKGNMTSDPTSQLAIALLEKGDEETEKHVRAIQSTYANVNVDQKRMMELYYFERGYGMSETQMALRLGSDRSHLWRQRKAICKELRKQLKR